MADTVPPEIADISVINLDSKPQDYTDFHEKKNNINMVSVNH